MYERSTYTLPTLSGLRTAVVLHIIVFSHDPMHGMRGGREHNGKLYGPRNHYLLRK